MTWDIWLRHTPPQVQRGVLTRRTKTCLTWKFWSVVKVEASGVSQKFPNRTLFAFVLGFFVLVLPRRAYFARRRYVWFVGIRSGHTCHCRWIYWLSGTHVARDGTGLAMGHSGLIGVLSDWACFAIVVRTKSRLIGIFSKRAVFALVCAIDGTWLCELASRAIFWASGVVVLNMRTQLPRWTLSTCTRIWKWKERSGGATTVSSSTGGSTRTKISKGTNIPCQRLPCTSTQRSTEPADVKDWNKGNRSMHEEKKQHNLWLVGQIHNFGNFQRFFVFWKKKPTPKRVHLLCVISVTLPVAHLDKSELKADAA